MRPRLRLRLRSRHGSHLTTLAPVLLVPLLGVGFLAGLCNSLRGDRGLDGRFPWGGGRGSSGRYCVMARCCYLSRGFRGGPRGHED